MFERFTHAARTVVTQAQDEARRLRHGWIGTEHLLLSLLAEASGAATVLAAAGVTHESAEAQLARFAPARFLGQQDAEALRGLGIDLDAVRAKAEETFGPGALERTQYCDSKGRRRSLTGHIPFSPRAKKVLELALREALALKHNWIGPEHILLGLLREGEGLAMRLLVDQGVEPDALRQRVVASLQSAA